MFDVNLPPLSDKNLKLDLPDLPSEDGVEYYLNLKVLSVKGTDLVPAGHIIAYEQLAFADNNYFASNNDSDSGVTPSCKKGNNSAEVRVGDILMMFNDNGIWKYQKEKRLFLVKELSQISGEHQLIMILDLIVNVALMFGEMHITIND